MKRPLALFLIMFAPGFAYGGPFVTNVTNGCNDDLIGDNTTYAVFTPNKYTCGANYYLPANAIICSACLSGYTCPGGTYAFNETENQGIEYTVPIITAVTDGCNDDLIGDNTTYAVFTPNTYTCSAGYYLPANNDGCVICPENSYCVGGTYTFNETTPQGIAACPSHLHSSVGMWEPEQCGMILHLDDEVVYLRQTKKTSPALHVDIDHDGIADFFANVTTADVPMHAGSQHSLRLKYNDVIYSIYDDTVSVNE